MIGCERGGKFRPSIRNVWKLPPPKTWTHRERQPSSLHLPLYQGPGPSAIHRSIFIGQFVKHNRHQYLTPETFTTFRSHSQSPDVNQDLPTCFVWGSIIRRPVTYDILCLPGTFLHREGSLPSPAPPDTMKYHHRLMRILSDWSISFLYEHGSIAVYNRSGKPTLQSFFPTNDCSNVFCHNHLTVNWPQSQWRN